MFAINEVHNEANGGECCKNTNIGIVQQENQMQNNKGELKTKEQLTEKQINKILECIHKNYI